MNRTAFAFWTSAVVSLGLLATPGSSQELIYEDGYIRHVEGSVHLQRALEPEPEPGVVNLPVLPGDRVWTEEGSRAEIVFSDGTLVRLDERTKIDVIDLGTEQLFHLWSGSIIVVKTTAGVLRVDSPAGSVETQTEGSYRIDATGGETFRLSVYEGIAEIGSDQGSVVVRRGQRSEVGLGRAPDALWAFRAADYDDFDRWSAGRSPRAASARSTVIRSLPVEVQPYTSELASYGEWRAHNDYGSVWYPTVTVGWAPYRDGRWCYTPYGYTWVSYEPWGWAPYHYGRWGFGSYGWYWIPGRHWGPAWVSFAVGPTWVGWTPLGYHGRPIYGFHKYVDGYRYGGRSQRTYRGGKAVPRAGYGRGDGWNFVDRKHFGRGRAPSPRVRIADVDRGSARARLFEEGAILNRDLTPRSIGAESLRQAWGARSRAVRRSTASIGRQARTALKTSAVRNNSDVQPRRGFTSPSRAPRSTPVERRRGLSSLGGGRMVAPSRRSEPESEPSGREAGRRSFKSGSSRGTIDNLRGGLGATRATRGSQNRRGGREVSRGATGVRPPTRDRAQSTRGRSSTQRGQASMAPSGSQQNRGIRSGNRASRRAPVTRGSRAGSRSRGTSGRGLGGNPGRGGTSRGRARKR